jgi:hypothetical protein
VQHIPPASSNETEYHILKFYPVDTPLVKHFLQNSDVKVDFPFKVTDLEHAVINLSGKEAILLLGRSGTGIIKDTMFFFCFVFARWSFATCTSNCVTLGKGLHATLYIIKLNM